MNVFPEGTEFEGFEKPGVSNTSNAVEERPVPVVSKPIAVSKTTVVNKPRVLSASPDQMSGALGPEEEAFGDSVRKKVLPAEGLALQASGGFGTDSRGVDVSNLPPQAADVRRSITSAGFANGQKLSGEKVGTAQSAKDVRESEYANATVDSGNRRPSLQSQAEMVAVAVQSAVRSVAAPAWEKGATDLEKRPADPNTPSGANSTGAAESSVADQSALPIDKRSEDRPGGVSRSEATEVGDDGRGRNERQFGVTSFGTPARMAGAPTPQSGLKLRASLRKRREEKGSVEDSPPGGMPSFDLGLDDLDEVADKLGSLSVVA